MKLTNLKATSVSVFSLIYKMAMSVVLAILETSLIFHNLSPIFIKSYKRAIFPFKVLVYKSTWVDHGFRVSLTWDDLTYFKHAFNSWIVFIEVLPSLTVEESILEIALINKATCSQDTVAILDIVCKITLIRYCLSFVLAEAFQDTINPLSFVRVTAGKHSFTLATQFVFVKRAFNSFISSLEQTLAWHLTVFIKRTLIATSWCKCVDPFFEFTFFQNASKSALIRPIHWTVSLWSIFSKSSFKNVVRRL